MGDVRMNSSLPLSLPLMVNWGKLRNEEKTRSGTSSTGGTKLTTKCQEVPRNQMELQMPFLVDVPQEFIC